MTLALRNRDLNKPIPHPILDDPSKMMRIIANPLYDKLTLSRAANIRKLKPPESVEEPVQRHRLKERSSMTSAKSLTTEQIEITPLPNPSEINHSRPQSRSSSNHKVSVPFGLPTPTPSSKRKSSRNPTSSIHSRATTAHSTTQSLQSALIGGSPTPKKSIVDGTIRYVNSRHGFEVQRYSSSNWLSVDVFTKDACQSHEKTFREMLEKKRHYERLSRSIYSSEYYTKRWNELLESYRQGYLTHAEWAKQNYQLICLRTLYEQAAKREQRACDLDAQDIRHARAHSAYCEWIETKKEENFQRHQNRINTARSQHRANETSFTLNNSTSNPIASTADENNTTILDTSIRTLTSTNSDREPEPISIYQPIIASKKPSASSEALYMFDEQRWSLRAMLKRVVGLAEPLPPPPKVNKRKQSPMTNASTDSGFESIS